MTRKNYYVAAALMAALFSTQAQEAGKTFVAKQTPMTEAQMQRWSHLDMEKDSIPGMSVDRAYNELIKGKPGQKVIVAVIDSGVDIEHPDLKSVIWTNPKEIAGNGIDDDKNGYIDDIHGWNFLGASNDENLELVRMLKKPDDGSEEYKNALAEYEQKSNEAKQGKQQMDFITKADKTMQEFLKKDTYTVDDLKTVTSTDAAVNQSKMVMTQVLTRAGANFRELFKEQINYVNEMVEYNLNKDFDGRKVVGDNPEDLNDKNYGNNTVYAPDKEDSLHGTHVAGIIAQVRSNGLGGDGVANGQVAIMSVRAVPNGDEYDKDIALAIRYAVDNGAKVINGSFGKDYSPHKEWVWDAIKYAESKDVLFVHAAGNDSKNIDNEPNFPTDSKDKKTELANNVITIGALNYEYGDALVADFSNYGKLNVDVFAPGVKIYATTPNNTYKYEQGTSMAAPNAAGVAALVRSYYPQLKAGQVKEILMKSGTPISIGVTAGEEGQKMQFTDISVSGKIINAYQALKMADGMVNKAPKGKPAAPKKKK
ncbi:MAG: peptidase S8 [Flavobacterium sp. BFFFF2]|nr:MAG: peptidase S8 [Flavobacterium sp. BFFFF2]